MDGSGRRIGRFRNDGFNIMENGVSFGPLGLIAVAGSNDEPGQGEYVKVWDWRRGEVIAEVRASADADGSMAFD